jgi:hypothetical protein
MSGCLRVGQRVNRTQPRMAGANTLAGSCIMGLTA